MRCDGCIGRIIGHGLIRHIGQRCVDIFNGPAHGPDTRVAVIGTGRGAEDTGRECSRARLVERERRTQGIAGGDVGNNNIVQGNTGEPFHVGYILRQIQGRGVVIDGKQAQAINFGIGITQAGIRTVKDQIGGGGGAAIDGGAGHVQAKYIMLRDRQRVTSHIAVAALQGHQQVALSEGLPTHVSRCLNDVQAIHGRTDPHLSALNQYTLGTSSAAATHVVGRKQIDILFVDAGVIFLREQHITGTQRRTAHRHVLLYQCDAMQCFLITGQIFIQHEERAAAVIIRSIGAKYKYIILLYFEGAVTAGEAFILVNGEQQIAHFKRKGIGAANGEICGHHMQRIGLGTIVIT